MTTTDYKHYKQMVEDFIVLNARLKLKNMNLEEKISTLEKRIEELISKSNEE